DLEGADDPAHPADVADERHPRDRHARRADRDRVRQRPAREAHRRHRDRLRHDQHRRRLPGHRPDARHVQRPGPQAEGGRGDRPGPGCARRRTLGSRGGGREVIPAAPLALAENSDFVTACYIVAFSLFILGIRQGTHPRTPRGGTLVAAAGMVIAGAITLSLDVIGNWGLIVLGIAIGAAVGVIASYRVQMTAMPQMVALYNGVGGGAAALISWSEFRH